MPAQERGTALELREQNRPSSTRLPAAAALPEARALPGVGVPQYQKKQHPRAGKESSHSCVLWAAGASEREIDEVPQGSLRQLPQYGPGPGSSLRRSRIRYGSQPSSDTGSPRDPRPTDRRDKL